MKLILIFIFSLLMITSCKKDKVEAPVINTYLHISHTKTEINPDINEEAKYIDFKSYDLLMLGGDISNNTTADGSSISQLNEIFNFGNSNVLWSIGNHDATFPLLISDYTNRPLFYSYYKDGITYLVLDTQTDNCNIINEQQTLFEVVTDSIQSSSHLVILHHKLIWMFNHPIYHEQIDNISNGSFGTEHWSLQENNFMNDLYPKIEGVQNRGVQVVCIGGDIGTHIQEFEYKDSNGIYFLASGFNIDVENNKVIEFKHNVSKRTLNWEFIEASNLQ